MATRRVLWSPEAEEDLVAIWRYVAQEASPDIADKQLILIDQATTTLREWPLAGRARDDVLPGMRSLVARPYVVFYRVAGQGVEVVRVLHGRRDIDSIFIGND